MTDAAAHDESILISFSSMRARELHVLYLYSRRARDTGRFRASYFVTPRENLSPPSQTRSRSLKSRNTFETYSEFYRRHSACVIHELHHLMRNEG